MARSGLQITESHLNWLKLLAILSLFLTVGFLLGKISEISKKMDKIDMINDKVILLEEIATWNETQIIERQKKVSEFYYKHKGVE